MIYWEKWCNISIHAGQCYYQSDYYLPEIFEKFIHLCKSIFDPTYPTNPSTFGQCLRKVRMDAGLKIKQFANASGLHGMTIINWEKDRTKPMPENLTNLAKVLEKCGCNDLSGLSQCVLTYPNIHINYNNKKK